MSVKGDVVRKVGDTVWIRQWRTGFVYKAPADKTLVYRGKECGLIASVDARFARAA